MGGQSGAVSWPTYMQTFHQQILDESGSVVIDSSIAREINTVLHAGTNPYFGKSSYDPAPDLTLLDTRIADWITFVDSLDSPGSFTQFNLAYDNAVNKQTAIDNTIITNDVAAFAAQQEDIIDNQVLPRFKAGMLNINAVNTSAFVIGEAIIRAFNDRDIAKYASDLRLRLAMQRQELIRFLVTQMMTDYLEVARFHGMIADTQVSIAKVTTATKNVQQEQQFSIDESAAKWNLELFQYAAQGLGAISGGGMGHVKNPRASAAVSALSGAFSGAAAGASLGPYGAAAGAVVGAGLALATR